MAKVKPKYVIRIPKNFADAYFFILWSLFAAILFSASMAAAEFNLLNPGNKPALISFYTQLHYFVILVVFLLCASGIFRFLRRFGFSTIFILYNILAIVVLAWGVYTYLIL